MLNHVNTDNVCLEAQSSVQSCILDAFLVFSKGATQLSDSDSSTSSSTEGVSCKNQNDSASCIYIYQCSKIV